MKKWIALLVACLIGSASAASPTTGLPLEGEWVQPVLLSIVHPADGKQTWGMQHADVVYETLLAQSGQTRFACLFHDALVNGQTVHAGPVRSIRQSHVKLAQEWQAVLLYTGSTTGNRHAAPALMNLSTPFYSTFDTRVRPYAWRIQSSGGRKHKAPSNMNVDVAGITAEMGGDFIAPGFAFGDGEKYSDYPQAAQVVVHWGDERYMCTYIYEETHSKYLRFWNGKQDFTWLHSTGEAQQALSFSNVIIQFADYDWVDGKALLPDAQLEGTGRAVIFTHGRVIEGKWYVDGRTHFVDDTGAEIALAPGKTYIAHMPEAGGKLVWE